MGDELPSQERGGKGVFLYFSPVNLTQDPSKFGGKSVADSGGLCGLKLPYLRYVITINGPRAIR